MLTNTDNLMRLIKGILLHLNTFFYQIFMLLFQVSILLELDNNGTNYTNVCCPAVLLILNETFYISSIGEQ